MINAQFHSFSSNQSESFGLLLEYLFNFEMPRDIDEDEIEFISD